MIQKKCNLFTLICNSVCTWTSFGGCGITLRLLGEIFTWMVKMWRTKSYYSSLGDSNTRA